MNAMVESILYPRFARSCLEESLEGSPVVLLYGPRQCGKTTLARIVDDTAGYEYITFDDDVQLAAAKVDVRFFERAYLEAQIQKRSSRISPRGRGSDLAVQLSLKDFVISNTDLIPEEVRSKVKKWSDYIDYWAVDWDFQNETFMQGWVAFRTRNKRKLPLVSEPHAYEKPGKYHILVKVIDIFGNESSQAFNVEAN